MKKKEAEVPIQGRTLEAFSLYLLGEREREFTPIEVFNYPGSVSRCVRIMYFVVGHSDDL